MFRKLRTRLVLINVVITTTVLMIAFAMIYIIAEGSMNKRPTPRGDAEFSRSEIQLIEKRVRDDRKESLNSLLASLVTIGLIVEVAVIVLSHCLANIAIRPIQESYDAQKTFIANASHEIKTPLAAISANLEAADIKNNRWIENVSREVRILETLNGELLQLAKADSIKNTKSQKEKIAVRKMIDEVVLPFKTQITANDMQLRIKVSPKNAVLYTYPADLRQILTILLDNAVKYGHKKLEIRYDDSEFCVQNDGTTISGEKLAHVFERFYQADKNSDGYGLGLAIAKAVAERNKWDLQLMSNDITVAVLKV